MNSRCLRPSPLKATCAVLLAWSVIGTANAPGQTQPQAPQVSQGPVFRSGVDLIAIDVNVVDKSGAPVRSLVADQFEVTVDGRPRRVISAELVDHARPPRSSADDSARAAEFDADGAQVYSSNDKPWKSARAGRLFFILVDQGSFKASRTQAVIAATKRFVDALQPTDRIGVVGFPGPGPVVAPTADHASVRIALNSISGLNHPYRPAGPSDLSLAESADIGAGDAGVLSLVVDRQCRGLRGVQLSVCTAQVREDARTIALGAELQTRVALAEMQKVIEALAVFNERKTLVVVSAGLPANDRTGGGLSLTPDVALVARDALKANANLYVLHLDSAFLDAFESSQQHLSRTPGRDASITASGLETLAGASGGTLIRVSSEAVGAFERVLRETASSYVLGLEPLEGDRDGKPHAIRISVKVPGSQVRSRREFIMAPVRAAPADPMAAALGAPNVATGLHVGVSTRTIGIEPTGGLRVLVTAQVGKDLPGGAQFTMGLLVRDARGRLVLSTRPETQRLLVPAGSPAGSAAYLSPIALPPGEYRLRLAAIDAEGRTGSVDHGFTVALTEGNGVMMGDLVLLHPARSATDPLAIIPDGRLQTRKVAAHLEVIAPEGNSAPTVTFGVADRPEGQLLVQTTAMVSNGSADGRSMADAVLDLALLPPGKYVAVAVVSDGSRNIGKTFEPLVLNAAPASSGAGVAGAVGTAGVAPVIRFVPGLSSGLVRSFTKADVLTPPVRGYFADRLREADGTPPTAAASALSDFRDGRFDAVLGGLSRTPSDGLSSAFLKGVALLAKGQINPAAEELRQALRISDEFLPAAFYLGACYAAGGKDQEAVGAWQTAIVSEADARIVYDVLVDALLRLEDGEGALRVLDEARDRWPDDERLLPRLAVAQALSGRRAEALATLHGYLEKHRTDTDASALAIRLIYEAHAAGQVVTSAQSDGEAASEYAAWYRSGGGQNQALIDRWLGFITKKK